jgi:hypothetical protein
MKNLKKYESLRLEEGDRQPKPIWAFLDVENLHVAWECYRGIIVHSLPPEPGKFFISSWVAPLFKDPNSPLTKNELKLEFLRQAEFPNKISRFFT